MDSLTLRKKYEKAFAERDAFLAGKPLPEQASEACWKALAQMTPAEALAFRRTEEKDEEKALRLLNWRRNPRAGITQAALVASHIYKGADGADTNTNAAFFGTIDEPFPSTQELSWLSDVSWALSMATDLSKAWKKTYTEDGGAYIRIVGGLNVRISMALLAIGALYLSKGKAVLFDMSGQVYAVPLKKLFDAHTFIRESLEVYREPRFFSAIQSYIEGRWSTAREIKGFSATSFTQKAFYSDIQEELGAQNATFSPFFFDGFETLTQTAALNVKVGKLKDLQEPTTEKIGYRMARRFETAFWDLMSEGVSDTDALGQTAAEPYRWKILQYLLYAPLKVRFVDSTGHPAYEQLCGATGMQGMPILVGKQGIGKSTLVRKLCLGWGGAVKDAGDSESQAAVYSRAQSAIVEYAELEKMTGRQIGHLKAGITTYTADINLKYANGLRRFTLKSLIVGTTNSTDFLADQTGSRRFWPITIERFDRQKTTDTYILTLLGNAQLYLNGEVDRLLADDHKKAAAAVLSLELPETAEDRAFKEAGFSRLSPQQSYVEAFIKEMTSKPQDYPEAFLGQSSDSTKLYFGTKKALEVAFESWLKGQESVGARGVFTSTLTEYIYGLPSTKKRATARIGGAVKRVCIVLTSELDFLSSQPVPPTPTQQSQRPAYADAYAERNKITPEMEDYYSTK
jgi:hypothetical protein